MFSSRALGAAGEGRRLLTLFSSLSQVHAEFYAEKKHHTALNALELASHPSLKRDRREKLLK